MELEALFGLRDWYVYSMWTTLKTTARLSVSLTIGREKLIINDT